MNILILAGGFGKRMYPLTENMPKALIPVKKKLVLEHVLEQLKKLKEVESVYILSNNKFHINFLEWLEDFKKRDEFSKKIKILTNGVNNDEERKGALGDLNFGLSLLGSSETLVLSSDDIFDFNLQDLIDLSRIKNSSTVALRFMDFERIKNFSSVVLDENFKVTHFEEKPLAPKSNLCALACYYLIKKDIEKFKKEIGSVENKDRLGNIVKILVENSRIHGKIFDGFWSDVASLV